MSLTGITGSVSLSFIGNDPVLLGSQLLSASPQLQSALTFVNGLVAVSNATDAWFLDAGPPPGTGRVLAPSATHTYVLGSIIDTALRSIPFVDIKGCITAVLSRTAGDHLTWGPGATHGWTARVAATTTIPIFLWDGFMIDKTDSLAVTSGSNEQVVITNTGSNPITFMSLWLGNSG
jgi:hypothetical protein